MWCATRHRDGRKVTAASSGVRRSERVLAIEERVYGTRDHYATAITETDLGALLLKSGEVERGAALILHAYRVFLAQLGPDHPYTRQLATLFGGEE